jgi:hypothetical protein
VADDDAAELPDAPPARNSIPQKDNVTFDAIESALKHGEARTHLQHQQNAHTGPFAPQEK